MATWLVMCKRTEHSMRNKKPEIYFVGRDRYVRKCPQGGCVPHSSCTGCEDYCGEGPE